MDNVFRIKFFKELVSEALLKTLPSLIKKEFLSSCKPSRILLYMTEVNFHLTNVLVEYNGGIDISDVLLEGAWGGASGILRIHCIDAQVGCRFVCWFRKYCLSLVGSCK